MSAPLDPLLKDLHDHAAKGEWWRPTGMPSVPAAWIRDLVVSGKAGGQPVHAEGVKIRNVNIHGDLNFRFTTMSVPLALHDVDLDCPLNLSFAQGVAILVGWSRIPSIIANELRLEYSLNLEGSVIAGEVNLLRAEIGSELFCRGTRILNPTGNALVADGIQVDGNVYLDREFRAEGTVRLVDAAIGGSLECDAGTFLKPGGIALDGDKLHVGGSVFLRSGFIAEGTVYMTSAVIGSTLDCTSATFHDDRTEGYALHVQDLTVKGSMRWYGLNDVKGEVSLLGASIDVVTDDSKSWKFADMTYRLDALEVREFVGGGDFDWTWQQRRDWLDASESPSLGPYTMVARWYRTAGSEAEAIQINVSGQDARSHSLPPWRRPFHWLWGIFAGYGYLPWRTALLLAVFYVAGVLVFSTSTMSLARSPEAYGFNAWVYSADILIPLIDLKQASQWAPTSAPALGTMWILITAGWVLSIALIAAVTGLFKQD